MHGAHGKEPVSPPSAAFPPPHGTACAGGSHPFPSAGARQSARATRQLRPSLPEQGQARGSALSGRLRLVPGLHSVPELSGKLCTLCGSRFKARHFRERGGELVLSPRQAA